MKLLISRLLVASIATTMLVAHTSDESSKSDKTGMSTPLLDHGGKSLKTLQSTSTPSSKSGKADDATPSDERSKGGKGSQDEVHPAQHEDNQSMSVSLESSQAISSSESSGKPSKSSKTIGKAFKGKGSKDNITNIDGKSFKANSFVDEMSYSMSMPTTSGESTGIPETGIPETGNPTPCPSSVPSVQSSVPLIVTGRPTLGQFLFDAKASKFGKEEIDQPQEEDNVASAADQIGSVTETFRVSQPYPEGITYDAANKRILLSSLTSNSIMSFDPSNGMSLTTTYTPDSTSPSGMGLKVDPGTGQVYATIDNFANQDNGGLAVYELPVTSDTEADATVVSTVYLPCTNVETDCGLANDVILDDSGIAYVTDSRVGRLFKVENGEIKLVADDSMLQWTDANFPFAVNGLVHVAELGILLAFNIQNQTLLRIDLTWDDVAEVTINGEINGGGDGMLLSSDGTLYAITGGTHITAFSSQDDWMSVDVMGTVDMSSENETATTMTFGETEDEIYVTHVRFGDLNGDGPNEDPSLISKVVLNN